MPAGDRGAVQDPGHAPVNPAIATAVSVRLPAATGRTGRWRAKSSTGDTGCSNHVKTTGRTVIASAPGKEELNEV